MSDAINHPLRLSLIFIHKLHKLDGLQPFLVLNDEFKKVPSNKVPHLASRRLIDLQLLHEMLETHEDILPSKASSRGTSLTWNSSPFLKDWGEKEPDQGGTICFKLPESNEIHPPKN